MFIAGFPVAYVMQNQEIVSDSIEIFDGNSYVIHFDVEEDKMHLKVDIRYQGVSGLFHLAILDHDSYLSYDNNTDYLTHTDNYLFAQNMNSKTKIRLGDRGSYYLVINAYGDYIIDYTLTFVSIFRARYYAGISLIIIGSLGSVISTYAGYMISTEEEKVRISGRTQTLLSPLLKPIIFIYKIPAATKMGFITIVLGIAAISCLIGIFVAEGMVKLAWMVPTIACFGAMLLSFIVWSILRNKQRDIQSNV